MHKIHDSVLLLEGRETNGTGWGYGQSVLQIFLKKKISHGQVLMLAQMCLLYYPLCLSALKRVLESSLCSQKTRSLVGETDVQTVITAGDRHFILAASLPVS